MTSKQPDSALPPIISNNINKSHESETGSSNNNPRSPKRQNQTGVLDKVKAKLSRSLSLTSTSHAVTSVSKENRLPPINRHECSPPPPPQLRDNNNKDRRRRCKSEVTASSSSTPPSSTSSSTAELLAQFVARKSHADSPTTSKDPRNNAHYHRKLSPKNTLRPIMSVDAETGIIAVNQMWICDKCSYAYNDSKEDDCDVCKLPKPKAADDDKTQQQHRKADKKNKSNNNDDLKDDFQLLPVMENDAHWICSRCTLENPQPAKVCLACSSSRSGRLRNYYYNNNKEHKFWACSKCTLKNDIKDESCKACEAKRGVNGATAPGAIKCPTCTFENKNNKLKTICEMCGTVLEGQLLSTNKVSQQNIQPHHPTCKYGRMYKGEIRISDVFKIINTL